MPTGVYKRTPDMKTGRTPMPEHVKIMKRGYNSNLYKGGLCSDMKKYYRDRRDDRHASGFSKNYIYKYRNDGEMPDYKSMKKFHKKLYNARRKNAGKLVVKDIQEVYERNIKFYGTLTCIYCLKKIEFGEDTLEHRHPLSRGGTNDLSNLAVACRKCNLRKHAKTEIHFRKEIIYNVKE